LGNRALQLDPEPQGRSPETKAHHYRKGEATSAPSGGAAALEMNYVFICASLSVT
jgi:hypothetical protein